MNCTQTDTATESRFAIEGSLDAHTVSRLRPAFDAVVVSADRVVVVDVDELTMIDSSGIALLIGLAKRLRASGATFRVERAHDQPLMVIKLLKLEALFGLIAPGARPAVS